MKVFFFINAIPPDYGGGYLRVFKTAGRFKESGNLYKIGTFTNRGKYLNSHFSIALDDIIFYKNKLFTSLLILPYQLLKHRREYDVFYIASTHWYTVIPSLIACVSRKKVVHGVTLSMVDSPAAYSDCLFEKPYYWFKKVQFHFANYIFVNSPLLVDECKQCGFNDNIVKLINNPVDLTKYHPVDYEEKKNLKSVVGIDNNYTTILFVGSINKRKGCNLFPEIFRKLAQKNVIHLNFIICGQKGYEETEVILKELDDLFKINDYNLIVKEEVSDTSLYYQIADLFLFPTTNEGMPNVILEAVASGCMILSNLLPGITDYVLSKECLIEDNNVEDFVNKLFDFINNPQEYKDIIKKNMKIIKDGFSITSVDESIKHILSV